LTGVLWLGLVACGGLTAGIGVRLRVLVTAGLTGASVDGLVECGVLAVGLALAAWLTGSIALAALCVTGRAWGVTWRAGERLVARCAPHVVRRALIVAVGAGIGLSAATGASAAPPVDHDLGWVATTATATAATAGVEANPAPAAPPPQTPPQAMPQAQAPAQAEAQATEAAAAQVDDGAVVVDSGDTLWLIARRHLPTDAGAADIAASWPDWYAANADVIGADPDLIHPGQVLHAPTPTPTPTDGAS
jgi:LysM repeat protein